MNSVVFNQFQYDPHIQIVKKNWQKNEKNTKKKEYAIYVSIFIDLQLIEKYKVVIVQIITAGAKLKLCLDFGNQS